MAQHNGFITQIVRQVPLGIVAIGTTIEFSGFTSVKTFNFKPCEHGRFAKLCDQPTPEVVDGSAENAGIWEFRQAK